MRVVRREIERLSYGRVAEKVGHDTKRLNLGLEEYREEAGKKKKSALLDSPRPDPAPSTTEERAERVGWGAATGEERRTVLIIIGRSISSSNTLF